MKRKPENKNIKSSSPAVLKKGPSSAARLIAAAAAFLLTLTSVQLFGGQGSLQNTCYALTQKTTEFKIGSSNAPIKLEMWHYSGGYWLVGNNSATATKITDAQIGRAINIGKALSGNIQMSKIYKFDADTLAKLQDGDVISYRLYDNGVPLYEIFNTSAYKGVQGDGKYSLYFKLKFNISSLRTMDDYVAGMSVTVPLVDIRYGENHYALYKNSASKGDGRGYYTDSSSLAYESGEIHPSMIADSSGKFKSGYTINNQISNFSSDGYYVGNNTFKNGGAVGLKFIFPFYVELYATRTEWVEDEKKEESGVSSEDSGEDDGGGSGGGSTGGGSGEDNGGGDSDGGNSESGTTGGAFDPSSWRIHRLN